MVRFTIMMAIAACLCVGPTLSRPDGNESAPAKREKGLLEITPEHVKFIDDEESTLPSVVTVVLRPGECYGCIIDRNVTDPEIVHEFNRAWAFLPDSFRYKNPKLVKATSQVVAGIIYTFKVEAGFQESEGLIHPVECDLELFDGAGKPKLKKINCVSKAY